MARVISPDELLTRGVARGEIYSYVENVRRFIARVEVAFVSWRERERESVFSSVVSRSWWMLFGVNISLALVFFLVMQSIVYEIRFDVVIYACDEKLKNN